jgi:hypothetical protein
MRLLRRKAGYLTQILLWQQNLQHGHDRHSGNGLSPEKSQHSRNTALMELQTNKF